MPRLVNGISDDLKQMLMKTKILRTLFLLSLLLTLNCENDDENTQTETAVKYSEIAKGALFGNGEEGIAKSNLVISVQTDWENLMNQMNSVNNVTDDFVETEIDFNNFEIIVVFLEVKGNGWEIEISEITENESLIFVSTTEMEFATSVMNQPFHIVKIPVTEKTIIFE